MEAKELKDFCGTIQYHGVKKKNADPDVKKLYDMFHSSTPEQKRSLLAKFKTKSGKLVTFAKEVVSSTVVKDDETHGTVADYYNRRVAFFFRVHGFTFSFPRISALVFNFF